MPVRPGLRKTYPDYFAENKAYEMFADLAGRTTEVPNRTRLGAIWQTFRDAYLKSVVRPRGRRLGLQRRRRERRGARERVLT